MTDKTKNYLGWAIIVGVLSLGLSALIYAGSYARTVEPAGYRSFAVSGEGKAVAIPDVAEFRFSVITEGGQDLAVLQTENIKKVNAAIGFVKENGVVGKDIRTENYSVEPRYQSSNCGYRSTGGPEICPPPAIVGYTIRQTVAVKARDFAKVGAILSGVVTRGANSVSQLSFTIDDPSAVESEARGRALGQAAAKARAVATAGGFRLGRLIGIDENSDIPRAYYAKGLSGDSEMAASVMSAPAIEPGGSEVRVALTLRYEIK